MASLFSWGLSSNGQLAQGVVEEEYVVHPRAASTPILEELTQLSCGARHCLLLLRGGSVFACGANDFGQLGLPASQARVCSPTQVSALETQQIRLVCCGGDDFSVAVNARGQLFSWGKNTYGQTGRPSPEVGPKQLPIKLVRQLVNHCVVGVACGRWHTLAFTSDSQLFAWGGNSDGQLGVGPEQLDFAAQPLPVKALLLLPIRQVSAGGRHSFCLSASRALFGWGGNDVGQLGLGDTARRWLPCELRSLRALRVAEVACGEKHTAVLTLSGAVFTFGDGSYGQLGHGRGASRLLLPRQVAELMGSSVNQVACGRFHTLALVSPACQLFAFGHGAFGQLGGGHADDRAVPALVRGRWAAVSARLELHWAAAGGSCSFLLSRPPDKATPPGLRDFHALPIDTADAAGLAKVLASPACLLASFLDDSHDAGGAALGLDLDLLGDASAAALDAADRPGVLALAAAAQQTMEAVEARREVAADECLRVCLLLPSAVFFRRQPREFGGVAVSVARFVTGLQGQNRDAVLRWMRAMKPRHLKRAVDGVRECLRALLQQPERRDDDDDDPRMALLQMLAVLYKANTEGSGQTIIQNEAFHIPDLGKHVDIFADYSEYLHCNFCGGEGSVGGRFFCNFPFIYDGLGKKRLMEAAFSMEKHITAHLSEDFICVWRIRRTHIIADTLEQLECMSRADMKKHLRVEFDNEEGIDEGGLTKEYFLLLFRELLDPRYGMFKFYDDSRMIWFKSGTLEERHMFEMIGKVCGLAVYHFTLVNLNFPLALFKKLLGRAPGLDDLKQLDPLLGKSLQAMLDYDGAEPFQELFCVQFEVARERIGGPPDLVPLCDGGAQKAVTLENREEYVALYVDYLFNSGCREQFDAFADGFKQACCAHVLALFEPTELLAVVEGSENYDWDVLKETAQYEGLFTAEHPVIGWFWQVFHEMAESDKKRFLLFSTGSDRVPLVGMSAIRLIFNSCNFGDAYYPVAHTCSSALDLPLNYSSKAVLRERLLTAIHCEGFGLV